MNKKILLITGLLASIAIFAGCSNIQSGDLSLSDKTNSGRIAPSQELSYDWQDIDIAGGDVNREFSFKNSGETDLILKGASTSCMCTTATFTLPSGEKSPDFGMHANQKWAYAIKPGESFSVDVVFDPMAHGPNGVGPIQRSVYILSSSVQNGKYAAPVPNGSDMVTEVKVSGDVLSTDEYKQKNTSTFQNISPQELQEDLKNKDFFLVDVHIPEQEHIEKTDAFIAYNEIEDDLDQLPEDKNEKIVVYCRSGSMSLEASQKLIELGYKNVYNLEGGRNAYIELTQ